ncbi:MAG TPA: ABC transporter permease, partial [Candidatus Saccharibacteria bacterium]|nr:ABC transporter permease [Candidatus Saccharibacteria bacterium]
MHNLGAVISFEVIRTLKKKSFWITALSFPVIIGVIFAIVYLSNQATNKAASETQSQHFTLAVTDQSGLIKPSLQSEFKA